MGKIEKLKAESKLTVRDLADIIALDDAMKAGNLIEASKIKTRQIITMFLNAKLDFVLGPKPEEHSDTVREIRKL
ncbi:hypothetical protein KBD69_03165 [Candidatus Woesebacteria bacterium]|nr:hypothetical protein [Candidatus Woesebacteria bacterium]